MCHMPAATSAKDLLHWVQVIATHEERQASTCFRWWKRRNSNDSTTGQLETKLNMEQWVLNPTQYLFNHRAGVIKIHHIIFSSILFLLCESTGEDYNWKAWCLTNKWLQFSDDNTKKRAADPRLILPIQTIFSQHPRASIWLRSQYPRISTGARTTFSPTRMT